MPDVGFLTARPFDVLIAFTRARAAPYRDDDGLLQQAAVNVPRFDHAADGTPLGILVEGWPSGSPDLMSAIDGDWYAGDFAGGTLLHEFTRPDGTAVRQATLADDMRGAIEAALRTKGWHRRVIALPWRLNGDADGLTIALGETWQMPGLPGDGSTGAAISAGGTGVIGEGIV